MKIRTPESKAERFLALACMVLLVTSVNIVSAQTNTITVQVDKPGAAIPATLFGLFFEDINFGADGGIYPERVKNRSFEFIDPLMAWKEINREGANGKLTFLDQDPINANDSHYMRIEVQQPGKGFGLMNEGFRGMGVDKAAEYTFSIYVRRVEFAAAGNREPVSLRIELEDADGRRLSESKLTGFEKQWRKYTINVRPSATSLKAHLNLFADGFGALDVDMVSLYPKGTWNNRENGLRSDLVQLLKDMKPGFLRFPGGCIVEGRYLETRYQWKKTIGDVTDRHLVINRWNDEFKHRPTPDYFQSFGLGFYEYFQLSEDIGAEPLPLINCGMACQFNSGQLVPLDAIDPYIQDALDLIEFANGPIDSTWGSKRAKLGHPKPFNLKMIGIGNEQWGPQYIERYRLFAKTLKEKHPEIALVAAAGPSPNDERFEYLWSKLRELKADIIDEHYYMAPNWFLTNVSRYDNYSRSGPKVFAGEYAAQSVGIASPDNRNNWECALSEAAFVTGLERNADVVVMASYAPLFAHVDAWQWTPNLIWFDNLHSYGTPDYYVQKLFSVNRGTAILPILFDGSSKNGQNNLYGSASMDARANEVVLKLVNTSSSSRQVHINLNGVKNIRKTGKVFVLASSDLKAENSLAEPLKVAPVEQEFTVPSAQFTYTLVPNSLTVMRIAAAHEVSTTSR